MRKDICATHQCVIDDALLETMSDIDQALLQFIDVMNLLDPLLHFSHIFVVNRVQVCAVGWQNYLVKRTQVSRFRKLIVPRAR